jgi:hypothetical protein
MLLHSGSGQYNRFRESIHGGCIKGNNFVKQFLWHDTVDMLGGRIIGEGADGCILSEPMWPCTGSSSPVSAKDAHYVSKVVSIEDEESNNLKIAARILGPELSARYIAGIQSECSPADKTHPSSNTNSMKSVERAVLTWPIKGQACSELKNKLVKGKDISKSSKIMIISKYDASVSGWIETLQKPYKTVIKDIERAIPQFMIVLQKLYQGHQEQLIHIDLHTGNIFVRLQHNGIEFGLADFGRCMFRRHGQDPSTTFYGDFLIVYLSRNEFFCNYGQIPFESRIMNYCFRKNLENVSPSVLVKTWENDNTVRMAAVGSTDMIEVYRSQMISQLLKRVLFISMIEQIQSICKKIRVNSDDSVGLYKSLNETEKVVVEFILTRYSILSPLNAILQDIMNKYKEKLIDSQGKGTNTLVRFLMMAMLIPYNQEGSSLVKALSAVQGGNMGIIWADAMRG